MADIDHSYGPNDQKEHANLMGLTADGNLKGTLFGDREVNLGALADGAQTTIDTTVTGAALGDAVRSQSFGVDVSALQVTSYVQAANNVRTVIKNDTGGSVDLANTTFRVIVDKLV